MMGEMKRSAIRNLVFLIILVTIITVLLTIYHHFNDSITLGYIKEIMGVYTGVLLSLIMTWLSCVPESSNCTDKPTRISFNTTPEISNDMFNVSDSCSGTLNDFINEAVVNEINVQKTMRDFILNHPKGVDNVELILRFYKSDEVVTNISIRDYTVSDEITMKRRGM